MIEKMVINIGTQSGYSKKVILEKEARVELFGHKIGDEIDGVTIGSEYEGYVFKITGGSDEDGVAMRPEFESEGYRRLLISKSVGLRTKRKGERKRRRLRGNIIADDISQLNLKVVKEGKKKIKE